mmetsp:Transcript_11858/g.17682  ORF Transcript_11858/g.17682 Transcript_11858/m.17682 type:complete len:219 (-) Transcript_11858:11-667(-)
MNARFQIITANDLRKKGRIEESLKCYREALSTSDDDMAVKFVALYRMGTSSSESNISESERFRILHLAWNIGLNALGLCDKSNPIFTLTKEIGRNIIYLSKISPKAVDEQIDLNLLVKKFNLIFLKLQQKPFSMCDFCRDTTVPLKLTENSQSWTCDACFEENCEKATRYSKTSLYEIQKYQTPKSIERLKELYCSILPLQNSNGKKYKERTKPYETI